MINIFLPSYLENISSTSFRHCAGGRLWNTCVKWFMLVCFKSYFFRHTSNQSVDFPCGQPPPLCSIRWQRCPYLITDTAFYSTRHPLLHTLFVKHHSRVSVTYSCVQKQSSHLICASIEKLNVSLPLCSVCCNVFKLRLYIL